MKLIIAGSRTLELDVDFIRGALRTYTVLDIYEVVCGGASGVDAAGERFAQAFEIPIKYFAAYWETYGKSAGPRRNAQMAEYGDALLLIWDGQSRGSANMKEEMLKLNKPVYEIILREYSPAGFPKVA